MDCAKLCRWHTAKSGHGMASLTPEPGTLVTVPRQKHPSLFLEKLHFRDSRAIFLLLIEWSVLKNLFHNLFVSDFQELYTNKCLQHSIFIKYIIRSKTVKVK